MDVPFERIFARTVPGPRARARARTAPAATPSAAAPGLFEIRQTRHTTVQHLRAPEAPQRSGGMELGTIAKHITVSTILLVVGGLILLYVLLTPNKGSTTPRAVHFWNTITNLFGPATSKLMTTKPMFTAGTEPWVTAVPPAPMSALSYQARATGTHGSSQKAPSPSPSRITGHNVKVGRTAL